jgi:hypothetical protein
MLKKVSILSAIVLTGCAMQPKPVFSPPPPPCEMMVGNKCKSMTAQEKSGATSLGYKNDEDLPAKARQP